MPQDASFGDNASVRSSESASVRGSASVGSNQSNNSCSSLGTSSSIGSDEEDGSVFHKVRMGGEDDTDMDDFVVHGGHDNPNDDQGEEAESLIFSTNEGNVALKLVCRAVKITGRVLLNLRGSMLLRKNRNLLG